MPDKSMDDLPDDMLDQQARAAVEFGFNKKQEHAIEYVQANIPISNIGDILDDSFWLREVVKDIYSPNPTVRSKALEMIGKFIGVLGAKGAKPGPRKVVEFED